MILYLLIVLVFPNQAFLSFCLFNNSSLLTNNITSLERTRHLSDVALQLLSIRNSTELAGIFSNTPWSRMPKDYFQDSCNDVNSQIILAQSLRNADIGLNVALGLLPSHKVNIIQSIISTNKILPSSFYPLFVNTITFFEYIYIPLGPEVIEENVGLFSKGVSSTLAAELLKTFEQKNIPLPRFSRSLMGLANPRYKIYSVYQGCVGYISSDSDFKPNTIHSIFVIGPFLVVLFSLY